ncbi:hypothetical protein RF11_15113 [Thelohanellus kitauei]|uniref:Uncharacterized protein n=1 Tax=Thelohanellus kitauei TaxID=669202 RepID=A0A0C2MLJ0_THEKT|nr:hypothetical protein RF11_15113 [Thelohanellus kitauei]
MSESHCVFRENIQNVKSKFRKIHIVYGKKLSKNSKTKHSKNMVRFDRNISIAFSKINELELIEFSEQFAHFGNWAFAEMSKQIPINEIIIRILNDKSMITLPFSDVKTMLTLMSDNNTFEESLSCGLKKILEQECISHIGKLGRRANHGINSTSVHCHLCYFALYNPSGSNNVDDTVVFKYKIP